MSRVMVMAGLPHNYAPDTLRKSAASPSGLAILDPLASHALQFCLFLAQFQPPHPAIQAFARRAGDIDDLHSGMDAASVLAGKIGTERDVRQEVDLCQEHEF